MTRFEIDIQTKDPEFLGLKEQLEDINGVDDMSDLDVIKDIFYVILGGRYDEFDLREITTVKQI